MKRKLEFGVTILPDPNSSPNKVSRFNESAQIDNRTDVESDIANRAQVTTINYIPCATFSANLTSALRKEGKGKKPRNIHTYKNLVENGSQTKTTKEKVQRLYPSYMSQTDAPVEKSRVPE